MSQLIEIVEQQGLKIDALMTMVNNLTTLVMKNKVDDTWVSESTAAEMLGYTDPRSLRKQVKKGKIEITYRSTNGRNYQYSRKSILKLKENTSFN